MLPRYKRILLKLSGEALMGDHNFGMDTKVISQYAKEVFVCNEAACIRFNSCE